MSLVIKLGKSRRIRMFHFQVHVMSFGVRSCITTLFTYVYLVPPFFVCIVMSNAMNLQCVGLEGTSLGKRLVTVIAFVGPDSWS